MNRKTLTALALVGSLFLLLPARATAQPFGRPPSNPQGRPAVSPFLNLSRSGNPAINYYGLVRPQQDTRAALQQLQQFDQQPGGYQLGALGGQERVRPGIPDTGHPVRFASYQRYFANLGGAQAITPLAISPRGNLFAPAVNSPFGTVGRTALGTGVQPFTSIYIRP